MPALRHCIASWQFQEIRQNPFAGIPAFFRMELASHEIASPEGGTELQPIFRHCNSILANAGKVRMDEIHVGSVVHS